MKQLINSLVFIIFTAVSYAQTDGISYQAIIIDNNDQEIPGMDISGNYLSEGSITLMFSIIDEFGNFEYQETQNTITDKYGMVNLIIGQGNTTGNSMGFFDEISWNGTLKQLIVSLSYDGSVFEELSNQELLFAPYAYHRNITASGTLIVDQESTLNDDLTVENQSTTHLTGDLIVDGFALFNEDALFNGHSIFNTLQVENESILNGPLEVNGIANFNNQFNVLNGSPSYLSGELNVDGISNFLNDVLFNTNISVLGNSTFNSANFMTLTVENQTTLNGNLNVENGSQTYLSGELTVNQTTSLESTLSVAEDSYLNGQVTISADVNGSQSNYNSYPLRVQGSDQGIAIKLDGRETTSHNFATFYDGFNQIHGRIEGQSLSQLRNSFRFIWDVVMGGLNTAFIAAEGVACSAQLDFGEAGVMAANYATMGTQWVELTYNYEANSGVSFASGGADYSEWLEKENPNEIFSPGEVVGIKGGKISKNTFDSDHILVISTNPIVVGNLPANGNEDNYEKVGFLGQVPTRIYGSARIGDYIIASGNNDGLAVAIEADKLPTKLYNQIIGVAWEEVNGESIDIINVAIGLNTNDLCDKVSRLENELDELKNELLSIKSMLSGEDVSYESNETSEISSSDSNNMIDVLSKNRVKMSNQEFEKWLKDYSMIFIDNMDFIKQKFSEESVNYKQYPEIARIVDDPVQTLRDMHQGTFLTTVWNDFEKRARSN